MKGVSGLTLVEAYWITSRVARVILMEARKRIYTVFLRNRAFFFWLQTISCSWKKRNDIWLFLLFNNYLSKNRLYFIKKLGIKFTFLYKVNSFTVFIRKADSQNMTVFFKHPNVTFRHIGHLRKCRSCPSCRADFTCWRRTLNQIRRGPESRASRTIFHRRRTRNWEKHSLNRYLPRRKKSTMLRWDDKNWYRTTRGLRRPIFANRKI